MVIYQCYHIHLRHKQLHVQCRLVVFALQAPSTSLDQAIRPLQLQFHISPSVDVTVEDNKSQLTW
jgi:hypothetical protein